MQQDMPLHTILNYNVAQDTQDHNAFVRLEIQKLNCTKLSHNSPAMCDQCCGTNEECSSPNTCTCESGWSEPDCDTRTFVDFKDVSCIHYI